MKIIYEANDGTAFDNELDCLNYEDDVAVKKITFKGLTSEFELTDELTDMWYVNILSQEDTDILNEVAGDKYGIIFPDKPGMWYYDSLEDDWFNIDEEIEHLYNESQKFKRIKDMLKIGE